MRERSRHCALASFAAVALCASTAAATGSASGEGVRWKRARIALTVDASVDQLGSDAFARVEAAATTWQAADAETPEVEVTRGAMQNVGYVSGGQNENCIRFAEKGEPLAKGALAVTVVTYEASAGRILDADILLNGIYRFGDASSANGKSKNSYDLQSVLTHELGHLHGLGDDLEHGNAAMYAWSTPGAQKRALSAEDEAALFDLYGDDQLSDGEAVSASCATVAGRTLGGWGGALFGLALAVVALGRRPRARLGVGALAIGLGLFASSARADAPAEHDALMPAPIALATATVADSRAHWDGGLIVTELTLSHVSCSGDCSELERVVVAGGRIGDIVQVVSHAPVPERGTRVSIEVSEDESELGRHRVAPLHNETDEGASNE